MERTILHVDCNKFYASVECYLHPELRDKPVAVGGSPETRHGIILTKNEIASKYNLIVGEPLWSARQKCPDLIIVPPNYPVYMDFSRRCRRILEDYTDYIEPFGLDESWLDISLLGGGEEIAHHIRRRIKKEVGITVSVGVSFNKIFAKLGSDYKKPDAVTVISRDNFRDVIWPLSCRALLFIGGATQRKLEYYGIRTIGELANTDVGFLKNIFGKNGERLHAYANGLDMSRVMHKNEVLPPKSIGNSTTTPRDLVNNGDVKAVMRVLCESIARRLRENRLRGRCVTINVRDAALYSFTRQRRLDFCTNVSDEILETAVRLFEENYVWERNIRSLGVSVSDFDADFCDQFDLGGRTQRRIKKEKIERAVDVLKNRYGNYCIQRAVQLEDRELSGFNPHDDHVIFPVGYRAS